MSTTPLPPMDRAAVNRQNAQKSSGPVTVEGKAICSQNAVKHGLTGNTVLLDSDDVDAYQQRLDDHVAQYKPITFEERRLVQSIHDSAWRLDRILNHESTIYAVGRMELQFCFSAAPEDQRKSLIELEVLERNGKKLRNLHIQEARLQRQRAKDIATLKVLVQQRQAEEQLAAETGSVFENAKVTLQPAGKSLIWPSGIWPDVAGDPPVILPAHNRYQPSAARTLDPCSA